MVDTAIGYRISPVYKSSGGIGTAAMMTSMISGKIISNTGGGGDFLTPEEFKAIKTNGQIKDMIREEASKPVPTIIQIVVTLERDAADDYVLEQLKAQGFALHRRGALGSMFYLVGEIYDTYLPEAKLIHGVDGIQLKDEVAF